MHDEPPPHVRHIEFAPDYHGLFHPWWSGACDNRRLHLARQWEFQWQPELHRLTLCKLGRHKVVKSWRRHVAVPGEDGPIEATPWQFAWTCYFCGYAPPLEEL